MKLQACSGETCFIETCFSVRCSLHGAEILFGQTILTDKTILTYFWKVIEICASIFAIPLDIVLTCKVLSSRITRLREKFWVAEGHGARDWAYFLLWLRNKRKKKRKKERKKETQDFDAKFHFFNRECNSTRANFIVKKLKHGSENKKKIVFFHRY